jgi:hypothetical protein
LGAMPKWKRWTKKDIHKLQQLAEEGKDWQVIAAELGRSVEAVQKKANRLGVNVVVQTPPPPSSPTTTTTVKLESKELVSVQKALELLSAALQKASEEGLDNIEIQRLNTVATLARTYENLFARFMQYREIEKRVVELEAKYARLAEEKS